MVNEALDCVKELYLFENFKVFVNVVWFYSFLVLENYIVENFDELEVKVFKSNFFLVIIKFGGMSLGSSYFRR